MLTDDNAQLEEYHNTYVLGRYNRALIETYGVTYTLNQDLPYVTSNSARIKTIFPRSRLSSSMSSGSMTT